MSNQTHLMGVLFSPTQADTQSVTSWFENYDALVKNTDVAKMIKQAHLPITVITDDSEGNCVAQQWNEEAFRASIESNVASPDTKIENNRQLFFLNQNLVIAITESTVSANNEVQQMRYADVLVKQEGNWKFKCMMQTGWGDMLKEYFGA